MIHDREIKIPVGNIYGILSAVERIAECIHRVSGESYNYAVVLAPGTRSFTALLDPIEGLVEPEEHRMLTYYHVPTVGNEFLCVSHICGVIGASVVTLDEMLDDVDAVPDEFLHG